MKKNSKGREKRKMVKTDWMVYLNMGGLDQDSPGII